MLEIIEEAETHPQKIMDFDLELLRSLKENPRPILHLYRWDRPAASYGHFLNPFDWLDVEGVEKHNLTLAKRPTGGGIVFHLFDLAFSLLIPANHPGYSRNTLSNYCFVNHRVMNALKPFIKTEGRVELLDYQPEGDVASGHFCMALPTKTDITLDCKKLSGGALRTTRFGFLHQGTISLCPMPEIQMEDYFRSRPHVYQDMKKNSAFVLPAPIFGTELEDLRKEVEGSLKQEVYTTLS